MQIRASSLKIFCEKSSSASSFTIAILCIIHDPKSEQQRLASLARELEKLLLIQAIQCRIYDIVDNFGSNNVTFKCDAAQYDFPILVLNAMTPSYNANENFNSWYGEEHIQLLQHVPFWLASTRYVLRQQAIPGNAPQYLALHGWGDTAAFKTEEYNAATNTPWRTEVINHVDARERMLFERWI